MAIIWTKENWTPEKEWDGRMSYHRLRKEGRWEEFSVRRKEHTTEMKRRMQTGVLSEALKRQANVEVLAEFPPYGPDGVPITEAGDATQELPPAPAAPEPKTPPPPPPPDESFAVDHLEQMANWSGSIDFERDFEWAYQNAAFEKPDFETAPSPAALFLWKHGRDAPGTFAKDAIAYFQKKNKESDTARELLDDKRRQFRLLELFESVA